jgi:hypothetical protein
MRNMSLGGSWFSVMLHYLGSAKSYVSGHRDNCGTRLLSGGVVKTTEVSIGLHVNHVL